MADIEWEDLGVGRQPKVVEATLHYSSFEDLFRGHYRRMVGALRLAGANHDQAEELAQEAMTRTLQHWWRVMRGPNSAGYAYTTAFRLLRQRGPAFGDARLVQLADRDPPVPGEEDAIVSRDAILGAMAAMPPGRRACAVAVLHLELSTEEAANALGLSRATVRTQVHRARVELHRALGTRVDNSTHP
jgi:RNA polymerase sigma factor (sigma-70 family)